MSSEEMLDDSSASIRYDWPEIDVEGVVEEAANASAARLNGSLQNDADSGAEVDPVEDDQQLPPPPATEAGPEENQQDVQQSAGISAHQQSAPISPGPDGIPPEDEPGQLPGIDVKGVVEEAANASAARLNGSLQNDADSGAEVDPVEDEQQLSSPPASEAGPEENQQDVQQSAGISAHQQSAPISLGPNGIPPEDEPGQVPEGEKHVEESQNGDSMHPASSKQQQQQQQQQQQDHKPVRSNTTGVAEEEQHHQQSHQQQGFYDHQQQQVIEEEERYYQPHQYHEQMNEVQPRQQPRPPTFQEVEEQSLQEEQKMMRESWSEQSSVSPLPPAPPKERQPDSTHRVHFDPTVTSPAPTASSHTKRTDDASQWRNKNRQPPPRQQQRQPQQQRPSRQHQRQPTQQQRPPPQQQRPPPQRPPQQQRPPPQRPPPQQQRQSPQQQRPPPQRQQSLPQRPPPQRPPTQQHRPPPQHRPPQQQRSTDYNQYPNQDDVYDVLIIGGGVVGLATLRAATLAGYRAVVVEAEADLLSGASSGNSGIACTGVDAAPGTLERALIRDAISQLRPFLKTHRIPFRDCGSLVCQWDWDKVSRGKRYESPLSKVLSESLDAGDSHARKLSAIEVGQWEPNMSPLCDGAVHIPGEIVMDPWLYAISLAAHARENGAKVFTHFEYDPSKSWFDRKQRLWNVVRQQDKDHLFEHHPPPSLRARAVVNATGIVADLIQGGTAGVRPPHWTAKPRRGQYCVFAADRNSYITHPIQPVPSQRTKGIFVYSSLYDHIVVGPTAEDQESRFDKSINSSVADDLTTFVLRIIPDLDPQKQYIGEYVGIRPATEHRDYQISLEAHSNWIVAAGIRSTGLTASLGIGRHMVHLLQAILPPRTPPESIRTSPLPEMRELVNHFNSNPNGNVLIHGYLYRVTHPLTRMGFRMRTGIASAARNK